MLFRRIKGKKISKLIDFRVALLAILILISSMLITQLVIAANPESMTIDVNVSETASLSIIPPYINWTQVATGSVAGYRNLTIKNSGSLNVSQIYAYIDTIDDESTRPYGTGDPSNYAAGAVITLRNESNTQYFFAGRLEWNWTEDIPSHDWSAVDDYDAVAWGFFRNTTKDYVWVLGNGSASPGTRWCNESTSQFSIETEEDQGRIDTRTPDNTVSLTTSSDVNWAYGAMTSGPLDGYCVAAYYDCSKVYIYKYDRRSNFSGCANALYIQQLNLTSGDTHVTRVDAWVPNGIPSGNLSQATLTFYAAATGP